MVLVFLFVKIIVIVVIIAITFKANTDIVDAMFDDTHIEATTHGKLLALIEGALALSKGIRISV